MVAWEKAELELYNSDNIYEANEVAGKGSVERYVQRRTIRRFLRCRTR